MANELKDADRLCDLATGLALVSASIGSMEDVFPQLAPAITEAQHKLTQTVSQLRAISVRMRAKDAAVQDAQRRLNEYQLQHQAADKTTA